MPHVLRDFDLLHHLTEGSTISGAVLADDASLPRTFGLGGNKEEIQIIVGELIVVKCLPDVIIVGFFLPVFGGYT